MCLLETLFTLKKVRIFWIGLCWFSYQLYLVQPAMKNTHGEEEVYYGGLHEVFFLKFEVSYSRKCRIQPDCCRWTINAARGSRLVQRHQAYWSCCQEKRLRCSGTKSCLLSAISLSCIVFSSMCLLTVKSQDSGIVLFLMINMVSACILILNIFLKSVRLTVHPRTLV